MPIGSGVCGRMNTPVREMFVTYSWMNASNDSNSLLIVTRRLRGGSLSSTSRFVGHRLTSPADRTARGGTPCADELDAAHEPLLGLDRRPRFSSPCRTSTTAGWAFTTTE